MFRKAVSLLGLMVIGAASAVAYGQAKAEQSFRKFYDEREKISRNGMYALGGWAVVNMAGSAAMLSSTSGSEKSFYQMNIYWNVVNAGIAGLGLYNLSRAQFSNNVGDELKAQHNIEKILLLNIGLNTAYITSGFYLNERARRGDDNSDQLRGFGRSVVLQGGFLMLLDLSMYFAQRGVGKKMHGTLQNIQLGSNGIGYIKQF